jgi:glycopeptide antibiotics resistance protein
MRLENMGLTVTAIGCVLGVLFITFGILFYLMDKKNRRLMAIATRTIGVGIITTTFSIPFSIWYHLVTTAGGGNAFGDIILSVFLGSPLLAMGIAAFIGLNAKAEELLKAEATEDKIRLIL